MRRVPASRSALVLAGLSVGVGIVGWAAQPRATTPSHPIILPAGSEAPAVRPLGAPARSIDPDSALPGVTQGTMRHCSIVGAVRYPGTYAARQQSVLLRSLIEHAGGLTDHAAGTVRILQNGRQQQVAYSADAPPVIVPPESVVVIDSSRPGAHVSADDVAEYADIACIHLLERPVVLWLKPADATIAHLLQLLGQPAAAAEFVQVIPPPSGRGMPQGRLASGTVLVFNPAQLDQVALEGVLQRWPLQDLISIEETGASANRGSEVSDILRFLQNGMVPASVEPVVEPSLEPHAASTAAPSLNFPVTAVSAETAFPAAPPTNIDVRDSAPLPAPPRRQQAGGSTATADAVAATNTPATLISPPTTDTADDMDDRRSVQPASALQVQTFPEAGPSPRALLNEAAHAEVAATSPPFTADETSLPAGGSLTKLRSTQSIDPDEQAQGNWLLGGLALGVLAGLGSMLSWSQFVRRKRRTQRTSDRIDAYSHAIAEARPSSPQSMLDSLINNTATVMEEPAVFQGASSFHGRTVGFRYLLRHGPHQLQGPHFAALESRHRAAEPALAGAQLRRADAAATSRFERVDPPAARAAQQAGPARQRGVSPLEHALRSLLRDRPSENAE